MIDMEKEMQSMTTASSEVLNKISEAARVDAVFGQPVQHGDSVVIPCAEISMGCGMGIGGGPGKDAEQGKFTMGIGTGAGSGVTGHPIAVVILSPKGVQVQPVVDATKIALAFFTTVAFILVRFVRLERTDHPRKGKKLSFAQMKKAIER